jgi:UDP-glucuronate 4-epimerase
MQPGDIHSTYADMKELEKWIGFKPKTSLGEGIIKFVNWYRRSHNIS